MNLKKIILRKLDKGFLPGGFVRDFERKIKRYEEDSGEEPPFKWVMDGYCEARKKEYIRNAAIFGLCALKSFELGVKYSYETFRVIDAVKSFF